MNYIEEAKNGSDLCIDRLRLLDVIPMITDLEDNDPVQVICRVFYAGYSVGYKDGTGTAEAVKRADQDGSDTIEVK